MMGKVTFHGSQNEHNITDFSVWVSSLIWYMHWGAKISEVEIDSAMTDAANSSCAIAWSPRLLSSWKPSCHQMVSLLGHACLVSEKFT